MVTDELPEDFVWGKRAKYFSLEAWAREFANIYKCKPTDYDLLRQCTGLCSCGSGEDFRLLIDILKWCAVNSDDNQRYQEPYGKRGTYCSAGHELAAKILDDVGLVTHGSGIGWPWITDWGRKVLTWIEDNEEAE